MSSQRHCRVGRPTPSTSLPSRCRSACNTLWSMGQQQAIQRLSEPKRGWFSSTPKQQLVASFSARAARIAATYARFYLEQEEGCNPEFRGRFYWMGLAAFASKQVKCALDFIPDDPLLAPYPTTGPAGTADQQERTGQRQFLAIPGHLRMALVLTPITPSNSKTVHPAETPQTRKRLSKPISALCPGLRRHWATLNNLMLTSEITDAFRQIRVLEAMPNGEQNEPLQLESL